MKKKQRCLLKRFATLVAALLMFCCLTVPALAAPAWPASPSSDDFVSHLNCWYVWNKINLGSCTGYELICHPMGQYGSTNTQQFPFDSYSTNSSTVSFTDSSGVEHIYMYALPYIPASPTASWPDLPSFPVGEPSNICGAVRLYPCKWRDYLAGVEDVFSDRSVFGFLTSWPSYSSSSFSDLYSTFSLDQYPIYVPSNIFLFGDRTNSSTNHVSFGIENGDNDFWASPFNDNYLKLSKSHLSTSDYRSFPSHFSIPSSEVGFVFCKDPRPGFFTSSSSFDLTLSFAATLWVPESLLPADVKVGDWISKADVESLQDQLVKDFDVNSDTLKNSKENFDSWQNSNTIDTDVVDTSLDIINGLLQNVGQFAFVVSLLCFGAVVLRVLIRKAVEG